ncbi:MAG: hypothetical protein ACOYVD_00890 [Bacillota bacterium]
MQKVYFSSMYSLFVIVFLNELLVIDQGFNTIVMSGLTVIFLFSSLWLTRGFQFYISIISLILGHFILFNYGLGLDLWHSSITKGIGMAVLMVAIPLISFPVKHGGYLDAVESYILKRSTKQGFLFSFLAVLHLALTVALNIGSIPTMQNLIDKIKFPKRYLAQLYTAGYSSYMVFSPYDGVVNMVLLFSGLKYSQYLFSGLVMVAAIIAVSAVILLTDKKVLEEMKVSLGSSETNQNDGKTYELLLHICLLVICASIGVNIIPFSNPLYVIAVIIIFYSTVWGLMVGCLKEYKKELKTYSKNLLSYRSFLPFLISASFLGTLISYTPFKENIGGILLSFNSLPVYLIVLIFILFAVILSLCGIHMMITVTTLALTVNPEVVGLSATAFALTLLTCWYMAMCISPFAPFAVIVAETIGDKPVNVTFRYNVKFLVVMIFLAPAIIAAVNYLT